MLCPLSPAAALNMSLRSGTLLDRRHLARQDWLLPHGELEGLRGNARVTELLAFPWARLSLGSLGLTPRLPLELLP